MIFFRIDIQYRNKNAGQEKAHDIGSDTAEHFTFSKRQVVLSG